MNIYIVSGEGWNNNGVLFASTNKEEAESFLNSFNNIDENGERIFDVFYFETFRDTWLTKGAGNHMRLATLALSCPRFKK